MIRNLLYNCFAPEWSNEWALNIQRLCEYADAFNGRKVVLLKTGPETVPLGYMKELFAPLGDVEFIEIPNNRRLGEVAGFMEGLASLMSVDPDEATFYAHTKGASYRDPVDDDGQPYIHTRKIREWRDIMYKECLADVERIEQLLMTHHSCGCFLTPSEKLVDLGLPLTRWVYAGTFFWVNHAKLFTVPGGHHVAQNYFGVEGYLGQHLPMDQGFNLYGTDVELEALNTGWGADCITDS